ncbi:MAG: SDR family oxidoreductase [Pirellulales bacterium]|nr:SDR family oxidoreductase [Pirellulales bacterium]
MVSMLNLSERVALVTGGSRGLGRACALRLAEAGSDVVINYVSSKSAALETAKEIRNLGRRAFIVKADVSEEDDVRSMIAFIQEEIGQLDIVISNAATGGFRELLTAKVSNFKSAFHTNVLALIFLVQAAMPLLEKSKVRGKVVAISSQGSSHAIPYYGFVGSSKAAMESIVRQLTLEIGDRGVNINVAKPGLLSTDSGRRLAGDYVDFDKLTETTQVGDRQLTPDDVANVVLFLSSPLSDLVQGEVIAVDGGSNFRVV